MPVIAVTTCRKLDDYKHAVTSAGGDVRMVDPNMSVSEALDAADGLMLTGGDDVAPSRYGEQAHHTVREVPPERDVFEIALVHEARRRRLPIFAICRGLQVLNVAAGGTLVQDIPSQVAGALEHKLAVPPHQSYDLAHEVWVEKGSLLSALLRERLTGDACDVNSRHHQAVKDIAAGFQASATSPDGVIEALEDPSVPFCLGVQWHPENFWRTGEFRGLFEGFVEAATNKGATG
jgi:putative glutamine amidotransferase